MSLELQPALPTDEDDSTRQRILDSARELYIEFGLRRTTMEDIAKRAGMGRATLYRRFSDKDQLFQAVIMRDVQRDLVTIEGAIQHLDNALDSLLEAFVQAATLTHQNPLIQRLLQTEPDNVLPFLTIQFDDIMTFARSYLAEQIKRAQRQNQLSGQPAEHIAELILRLLQSLLLTPSGCIHPGSPDQLRQFADLFLRPLLDPKCA